MTIPERSAPLNDRPVRPGDYVLYWMQQAQRADCNHALEYAIAEANRLSLPVLVGFGLTDRFPDANQRHYRFMLEGLSQTRERLLRRGFGMVIARGEPDRVALRLSRDAALVVCDRGYLRIQREWRSRIADSARCRVVQVETDVVVPLELASSKEEFSAATLRPKLNRLLKSCLRLPPRHKPRFRSDELGSFPDLPEPGSPDVPPVTGITGGAGAAAKRLRRFLKQGLAEFATGRNDPGRDRSSQLSPYLHFGQVSPIHIVLRALESGPRLAEPFIEELVVRRELATNFVFYNDRYDSYDCLPDWARRTLDRHRRDPRDYVYSRAELEAGRTHDRYWNAAQAEMVKTGRMHGYMRMYWGKKILEWTERPEEAYATALYLNNRYELDGRDPNGFAGVAWCFGKHDRPWQERPVFGMVRYMNANGLERKFDMGAYVERVARLGE